MYYAPVRERMSRARTPMGTVPISAIYGYEYPLADRIATTSGHQTASSQQHSNLSDCVDYMVHSSRAMSENRVLDPYNLRSHVQGLSFLPSALEEAHRMSRETTPTFYKAGTPIRSFANTMSSLSPLSATSGLRYGSIPPTAENHSTTISYGGTSAWNSTGFHYTPRYPQSYRGTASTTVPYARRYPARRFVPSYVPIRYSRRY